LTKSPEKWNTLFAGFVQDSIIPNALVVFRGLFVKPVSEERKKSVSDWPGM